jgi:hypothetical protein
MIIERINMTGAGEALMLDIFAVFLGISASFVVEEGARIGRTSRPLTISSPSTTKPARTVY